MTLPGPFAATGVGSLPHRDADEAVRLVLSAFPEVPFWPQLPRRSPLESMYVQYAAGLPGAELSGDRVFVAGGDRMIAEAEGFYERFLGEDPLSFSIPRERAAGLHRLLDLEGGPYAAVKGQVTGPVSFGLMVTDREKRPLFYDPVGRDVLVKHLTRIAQWQAARLSRLSPRVILVIDEPYLASVGSAVLSLSRDEVIAAIDEIVDGLPGILCGVHCCANTDWGLVLSTRVGYLSFDAYEYASSLLLYPEALSAFLSRGGTLAFGIVPTGPERIAAETVGSLAARMEGILGDFERRGIARGAIVRASLVTPACGLGTLSPGEAEAAARLTSGLSRLLRQRYG